RTGSPLGSMALFLAARLVPAFLAPAMTARVDRVEPNRVLPALYLLEAAVFGVLAALTTAFWLPAILLLGAVDGTIALTARGLTRGLAANLTSAAGLLREGNALLNFGFAAT